MTGLGESFLLIACAALPWILQGIALIVDECVFHWRRGLPRWECIGHPLDTLSVLVVVGFVSTMPLTASHFWIFILLSAFSCIFVTKDEWVHAELCDAREHWLHSILFVCHPLVFVSLAFLWCWRDSPSLLGLDALAAPSIAVAIQGQSVVLAIFMLYQIIYWNFVRPRAFVSTAKWRPPVKQSESVDPQPSSSAIG